MPRRRIEIIKLVIDRTPVMVLVKNSAKITKVTTILITLSGVPKLFLIKSKLTALNMGINNTYTFIQYIKL